MEQLLAAMNLQEALSYPIHGCSGEDILLVRIEEVLHIIINLGFE